MHRIASRAVADYWRQHYQINYGLNCGSCGQIQRRKCKESDLYTECPKAVKLEYLSKPIMDKDGHLSDLGDVQPSLRLGVVSKEAQGQLHGFNVAG